MVNNPKLCEKEIKLELKRIDPTLWFFIYVAMSILIK